MPIEDVDKLFEIAQKEDKLPERLQHSLRGPDGVLDRVSYNRPFPPVHRPAGATTKPAQT
jgi:hypothetical protein